jgi:hypothetical protein
MAATHRYSLVLTLLAAGGLLAACGGDPAPGEPLLSGSVSGAYGQETFTAIYGFAIDASETSKLIGVGDGPLNCQSPEQPDPPPGMMGSIRLPSFEVGTYTSVMVNVYNNRGSFVGKGSNAGTAEITASSADSVAGSVAYSDDVNGTTVSLQGTFEVVRCRR